MNKIKENPSVDKHTECQTFGGAYQNLWVLSFFILLENFAAVEDKRAVEEENIISGLEVKCHDSSCVVSERIDIGHGCVTDV